MKRAQLNTLAQKVLVTKVERLSKVPYAEIAQWPEYPKTPEEVGLYVPPELSDYKFTLMKDTQPDKSIRVAIQLYRHRFFGFGQMSADGFFIVPNETIRQFTERDVWAIT
ncbi:MAG: hypothetical protein KF722_15530 [Nitrospira sp.]|nr:hypothetical protein [Nitrospira sp.]